VAYTIFSKNRLIENSLKKQLAYLQQLIYNNNDNFIGRKDTFLIDGTWKRLWKPALHNKLLLPALILIFVLC
jgi:hypothetical protein